MNLLQELSDNSVDLTQALNESIKQITDGHHNTKSLYEQLPGLVIQAAKGGVAAYNKSVHASNRNTIKLYAKDPYEKRMMTKIVKELTKSGKYYVTKTKYNNGQHWELKRTNK